MVLLWLPSSEYSVLLEQRGENKSTLIKKKKQTSLQNTGFLLYVSDKRNLVVLDVYSLVILGMHVFMNVCVCMRPHMCSNKNVQYQVLWHSGMVGRYSYSSFSRESLCTYKDISHWQGNSPYPKWKKLPGSCLYGKCIAWVIVSHRRWTSCRAGDQKVSCPSYPNMIYKLPLIPFFFLESSPPLPPTMENEIFSGFSGHKADTKGTALIKAGKSLYTPWDRGTPRKTAKYLRCNLL